MIDIAISPGPGETLWRVHRATSEPFDPAPWEYCGSGRFDDPADPRAESPDGRFRVVFCTSHRPAAFAETIAQLGRREPATDAIRAATRDVDDPNALAVFADITDVDDPSVGMAIVPSMQ